MGEGGLGRAGACRPALACCSPRGQSGPSSEKGWTTLAASPARRRMHQVRRGGPRLGSARGRPRARWSLPPRTGSLQPSPPHFLPLPARQEELWRLTATRKQRKQQTTRHRRPHLGCDGGCPRARWCQPPRAQPLESPPRRFRHGRPNFYFRFLKTCVMFPVSKLLQRAILLFAGVLTLETSHRF